MSWRTCALAAALVAGILLAVASCRGGFDGDSGAVASSPGATRGRVLLRVYGCGACHTIPGVPGARGEVGPPLVRFSRRTYIAGEIPNTPANLARWIQSPQSIEPNTAMPNMGVGPDDARAMAAYLNTLR